MMQKSGAAYRRRKLALYSCFLLCCMCIVSSCSSFSGNLLSSNGTTPTVIPRVEPTTTTTSPDPVEIQAQELLSQMNLNDKLAQMIMVEYLKTNYTSSGLQTMVAQQHVGGVVYQPSNGNFGVPDDTIDMVNTYSEQITIDDTLAPLIGIDQEGGQVDKLSSFFSSSPSAEQLAQSGDSEQVYNQAQTDASELKQLGINVDLAPVVDVGPNTNLMGSRMFSSDPDDVTTYAGAFVKGLQDNEIAGTLKHFPGLGSVSKDSPDALPVVSKNLKDLESSDLLPYKQIIQLDDPAMIMTTDVLTKALDPTTPAELSPKVIDYLRQTLQFNGVVMTDSMTMKSLYNGGKPSDAQLTQACVRAVEAGNDIIEGPETPTQVSDIITALTAAIQQGNLPESQIDQSVTRILMMKIRYGIIKSAA